MKRKVHNSKRPLEDGSLRKGSSYDNKKKTHVRVQTDKRLLPCDFCGKSLTTKNGLNLHVLYII